MKNNISAYLQIYNDYEFLKDSLESVKDYIDEVIIVDGCYSWMANFYESIGFNPVLSSDAVYEVLSDVGLPYKVISAVWDNQLIKRKAGYEACSGKYVMRLDSDELININSGSLDNFFSSGASVCGMSMPTYLSSDLIVYDSNDTFPVQNFIFDAEKITATDHLEYMWLVLTKDIIGGKHYPDFIYKNPVAFNKHLTSMRSLFTSRGRSAYYNTNWIRKHGFPYITELNYSPDSDVDFFKHFFDLISPSNFYELLVTDKVSVGLHEALELKKLSLTDQPLDHNYFTHYLNSFADFYKNKSTYLFISGKEIIFDVSLFETKKLFFKNGLMICVCDCTFENISVKLNGFDETGAYFSAPLTIHISGCLFEVEEPNFASVSASKVVRAFLQIDIASGDEALHKINVL